MFGKRVLNVEVYGDQTIYGIKTFKDSIVVPENTLYCYQIADIGTFITDKNYVTLIALNTKLELYATISSLASYATNASLSNYATKVSPTFSGTVTFVDTSVTPNTSSVITDYLKSTTAASTYLTQSSASNTYLTQSNASSYYLLKTSAASTYAPLASPTFSGTVTLPDGATINSFGSVYARQTALNAYAPLASPSFTGTVTFIDTSVSPNIFSVITDYLKSSLAASTYLTISNAANTYLTITNAASYLTTSNAASTYLTISNAASTYLTITNAGSTYLTKASAATIYASIISPTFSGTVTLPNGTVINQNSAAFLTSVPNNYLTTSTIISQSQINDESSGWISKAIVATAASAAAGAVLNALYTTAGVLIYATKIELAITDLSVSTLSQRLSTYYETSATARSQYLGPWEQNYTLGSANTSGDFTTQIHQNLQIGTSFTSECTSVFYGKVYLRDVVNSDTSLTIGKMNSVNETELTPLNIYKYTNFNKYVYLKDEVNRTTTLIIGAFNGEGENTGNSLNIYKVTNFNNTVNFSSTISSSSGFIGQLKPPNSGGSIYGVNETIMNYDVSTAIDPQHQFKINGGIKMLINNSTITCYNVISSAAGIKVASTNNTYHVGGDNTFDATAITAPKVVNGIASGTADGNNYFLFNNAINSWWGTGFVDTCNKRCYASIDHRTGNFITYGFLSAGNNVYTPTITGISGLDYDTTTSTAIHNFKINGVQKMYLNNTDLTNTINLTQVGDATFNSLMTVHGQSTFNSLINALSGITLGGTNSDPVMIIKNIIGSNVSELALCPGDDGSGNTLSLPLSGDTNQDYVTVRTNSGVHHAFSTSGNYYCAGNIVVTGTVTANTFIGTSSNIVGAIVNAANFAALPLPTNNSVFRLNYITLTAGTWIVTSQVQMNSTNSSVFNISASVSLSNTNGSMDISNISTTTTSTPFFPALHNTLFYTTSTTATVHLNFTFSATYYCNIAPSGCFLKAMRIA